MQECMASDWNADLDQIPDYPSTLHTDCRKGKPLKRHAQHLRRPIQGWPKDRSTTWCPTPVQSPEYIPMIYLPKTPKPSEIRKTLFREAKMRPQGWLTSGPEVPPRPTNTTFHDDMVYTDPINRYLYNKLKEVGEDTVNNNLQREQKQDNGHYEPIENKETMV